MKNNWPDNITIQQYLKGTLDAKLMHQLEEKSLEDPFLADALEGYSQTPSASDLGLSILQRQLQERIMHQQENKKVFDLSWQRLSIAAAAAVLFISAGILFWMNNNQLQQKSALQTSQTEVNLTPKDSVLQSTARSKEVLKNGEDETSKLDLNISIPIFGINADEYINPVSGFNTSDVQPKAGWENYSSYIRESVLNLKTENSLWGIVELNFTVNKNGTPENFKKISGLTENFNNAVSIIKNGPLWKSVAGQSNLVILGVNFGDK